MSRDQITKKMGMVVIPDDPAALLDEYQMAKMLGCSIHKLRRDRWAGGGIPFIKLNEKGSVRYRRSDFDSFVSSRVRKSTSDTGR